MKSSHLILMAVLTLVIAKASAFDVTYNVTNIAELQSLNVTGLTNEIVDVLGYYTPGDRGGGLFQWDPNSSVTPDGGLFIQPNSWSGNGRWVRNLTGEIPNVKMWGAMGNWQYWSDINGTYAHDDTTNIQNALNAGMQFPSSQSGPYGQLLIPYGFYKVTSTLIIGSNFHLMGEGTCNNTHIRMLGDHDVFRTSNCQSASTNGPVDWDQGLIIENLYIIAQYYVTNGAAIELCNPGEASVIRNVWITGFGYGIRSFGVGAPGLRLQNVSIFDSYAANIDLEGFLPNGTFVGGGGPVTLMGISGDHRRADSDATASFVLVNQCTPTVSIYDFKAEGDYGGGLVNYIEPNYASRIGSLSIYGGTWNAGGVTYPADLVVLNSYGNQTASVTINTLNLYGVRYLINDEYTGRTILPHIQTWSGNDQTACRQPISYQGSYWWTRYLIGDTAYSYIEHPVLGWYRVMQPNLWVLGGSLGINSVFDASKIDAELYTEDPNISLNVLRTSRGVGLPSYDQPFVSAVRAGDYYDPSNNSFIGFVDIDVTSTNTDGFSQDDLITLAHPIEGRVDQTGREELLSPTAPLASMMPSTNCIFIGCVTNQVIR